MRIVLCHSLDANTFTIFSKEERYVELAHSLLNDVIDESYLCGNRDIFSTAGMYESNWDFDLTIPIQEITIRLSAFLEVKRYTHRGMHEYDRSEIKEILENA